MDDLIIRSAHDRDSRGLIALIEDVFAEYAGCVLDIDGEMPELRKPASAAHENESRWWVAELNGTIVGSILVSPAEDNTIELKRLYVAAPARRRGLGAHLVRLAESEASHRAAQSIFLWTDTRFEDAHRLYERLSYRKSPRVRALNDSSHSIEFHYTKDLRS